MKVIDIERVVILMRFIQYGWAEETKRTFDESLRIMLKTQCEDLEEHDKKIRTDAINECIEALGNNIWDIAKLEQLKSQKT